MTAGIPAAAEENMLKTFGFFIAYAISIVITAAALNLSFFYLREVFPVIPAISYLDLWFGLSCVSTLLPSVRATLAQSCSMAFEKMEEKPPQWARLLITSLFINGLVTVLLTLEYVIYRLVR